jgi:2-keto-4-pentenoate hydratase/2-oxohepta-3-ene-1,7-dioic acid hydratase in catechol pathway
MQGKERASMDDINFELRRNGSVVQKGNTGEMIFDVDRLIAHISRFMTLRTGDLIFTGTPAGVGPVQIGDVLDGTIEGKPMLHLEIK